MKINKSAIDPATGPRVQPPSHEVLSLGTSQIAKVTIQKEL
jgi:hypothetical protein